MASAFICQDKRNCLDEMRNINGNYTSLPNVVDNTQGDEEISRLFADKYSNLYNSVSYDANNMYVARQELVHEIEPFCDCSSLHNITVDKVTKAVLRLKPHKADGEENASSDLLINSCHKLAIRCDLMILCFTDSVIVICCYGRLYPLKKVVEIRSKTIITIGQLHWVLVLGTLLIILYLNIINTH